MFILLSCQVFVIFLLKKKKKHSVQVAFFSPHSFFLYCYLLYNNVLYSGALWWEPEALTSPHSVGKILNSEEVKRIVFVLALVKSFYLWLLLY